MAVWFRPHICSALNRWSFHRCGFGRSGFSGYPIFTPPFDGISLILTGRTTQIKKTDRPVLLLFPLQLEFWSFGHVNVGSAISNQRTSKAMIRLCRWYAHLFTYGKHRFSHIKHLSLTFSNNFSLTRHEKTCLRVYKPVRLTRACTATDNKVCVITVRTWFIIV